jgi:ubiquinone biosynthesis protein
MTAGPTLRRFGRYRQILGLVAAHGFGYLLDGYLLPSVVERLARRRSDRRLPRGVRLRRLLEDLGPTFVKLGQLLSLRPDLLPGDLVRELERLQDHVPPEPPELVRAVLEAELGAPPESLFATFEWQPIAAASLGQVHAAALPDGRAVVVKVQRPGVRRTVEDDLEVLSDLVRRFGRHPSLRAVTDPEGLLAEFRRSLHDELDYTREGRHADAMRRQVHDTRVAIPHVYWNLTTGRVLTLEALYGVKPTDREAMAAAGHDPRRIARLLAQTVLHAIFEAGYFHADPHPGNLAVLPDGRLAVYDLGMVGRLAPELRDAVADLSASLLRKDSEGVVAAILALGEVPPDADLAALAHDVEDLRDRYYDVPLPRIDLADAVSDVLRVAYRHRVRVSKDLSLLGKALVTLEGVVRRLDPDLSMLEVARPFGRTFLRQRLSTERVGRLARAMWRETALAARHLPRDLGRVADTVARAGMPVRLTDASLRRLEREAERSRHALGAGMVLVAATLALGLWAVAVAIRPAFNPWRAFGAGWVVLPLLAVWVIWAGRRRR